MIFAISMAGLGVQCMLRGNAVPALEPVSSSSSLPLIGWITGIVLFAAAVATLVHSKAYYGAILIAAMLLLWVLLLHVPRSRFRLGTAANGREPSRPLHWVAVRCCFSG